MRLFRLLFGPTDIPQWHFVLAPSLTKAVREIAGRYSIMPHQDPQVLAFEYPLDKQRELPWPDTQEYRWRDGMLRHVTAEIDGFIVQFVPLKWEASDEQG